MTLRLTVDRQAWLHHVRTHAAGLGDTQHLVPVVKGNGYGFGRPLLIEQALSIATEIAVGTVFEAYDIPPSHTPIVLTPVGDELPVSLPSNAVLVVGSVQHVNSLVSHGWSGRVIIKLRSSVQRFGVAGASDVASVVSAVNAAGFEQHGWSVHPPLDGTAADHMQEIAQWLSVVPNNLPMYVSHIDASTLNTLRTAHSQRKIVARSGTSLWLGDKSMLTLGTDVLDVSRVNGGTAGYRNTPITGSGSLVVVGCGSSHGVAANAGDLSPFHFAKQRLTMLEPPHMHSTILFVQDGATCPTVNDIVDVQQPLTRVFVDTIAWK
jgi:alanine racemase